VTQIPNPDSWMDVATILAVVAMMSVPSWFAIKAHKTSTEVLHQTRNGHTVPLRADLDRAINAIEALAHDVQSLRKDLMAEEDHRRLQISDLRQELEHRTGRDRRH
jgi:hypothetical protein